ncbi:hypothetical protein Xlen_00035 [Xanthomonas campestris pv. leeana]|nr:hypothetical protein Xths_10425 [Xanthomonas campestris pv. thespesiae]OOW82701.1 hypothetical protein Xlen_00035 [Xanthomonas campestris pv. leeana]
MHFLQHWPWINDDRVIADGSVAPIANDHVIVIALSMLDLNHRHLSRHATQLSCTHPSMFSAVASAKFLNFSHLVKLVRAMSALHHVAGQLHASPAAAATHANCGFLIPRPIGKRLATGLFQDSTCQAHRLECLAGYRHGIRHDTSCDFLQTFIVHIRQRHADEGTCGKSVSGGMKIGQFHSNLKEIENERAFKKRLLPQGCVLHCARIVGRIRDIG